MKTLQKDTNIIGVRRKDVSIAGCVSDWEDFSGTLEDVINDTGRHNITHIMTDEAEYAIPEVESPPEYLKEGATVKSVWAGDTVEGKIHSIRPCQKFGFYNVYISEDPNQDPICVPAETCTLINE